MIGLLLTAAGIACQQLEPITRRIFDREPPYTLTKLVQYVEGGVLVIISFAISLMIDSRHQVKTRDEAARWAIIRLVLAFFWTGGGVVLANIYAAVTGRDKAERE
jgi:uncharacterized membrane protein